MAVALLALASTAACAGGLSPLPMTELGACKFHDDAHAHPAA
eukprot:COSAG03_NODE_23089_length_283_cov_1.108696_1_plen_41_part_10